MATLHRSSDVIRPKVKVRAVLTRTDGAELEGFVYVSGQERVLDLLNGANPFIPFERPDGTFVLLNKAMILALEPDDAERMASSYQSAVGAQMSGRESGS